MRSKCGMTSYIPNLAQLVFNFLCLEQVRAIASKSSWDMSSKGAVLFSLLYSTLLTGVSPLSYAYFLQGKVKNF